MDHAIVRKMEKAKRYAEERNRIRVESLTVKFEGDNNPHLVTLDHGTWQCDCDFFQTRLQCSHTMALEIILDKMIPQPVESV